MSNIEEPVARETVTELVRRLGVAEAEKEILAGELERVRAQLVETKEEAEKNAAKAEHWEGVYAGKSGAFYAREHRVERLAEKLRSLRAAIADALSVELLQLIDRDDEEEGKRYR